MTTYVIFAHLLRQVAALQDQDHHFMVHWLREYVSTVWSFLLIFFTAGFVYLYLFICLFVCLSVCLTYTNDINWNWIEVPRKDWFYFYCNFLNNCPKTEKFCIICRAGSHDLQNLSHPHQITVNIQGWFIVGFTVLS
mgnify:CR=1 FL=1